MHERWSLEDFELLRDFTWVVYPGLDYIIQCKPAGCLFGAQLLIKRRCEDLGHMVVVLAEVGVFLLTGVLHLQLVVTVPERHGCCSLSTVRLGWKINVVTLNVKKPRGILGFSWRNLHTFEVVSIQDENCF